MKKTKNPEAMKRGKLLHTAMKANGLTARRMAELLELVNASGKTRGVWTEQDIRVRTSELVLNHEHYPTPHDIEMAVGAIRTPEVPSSNGSRVTHLRALEGELRPLVGEDTWWELVTKGS